MGKRSEFARAGRDLYHTTDPRVVPPLARLVRRWDDSPRYDEPCAGNGSLIRLLQDHNLSCAHASDIMPSGPMIEQRDVFDITQCHGDCFITNPPWDRKILHPMITHLSKIAPTWLLFDADWAHTLQSRPFMPYCHFIVSVGRVKWFQDTAHDALDNCCWYLFEKQPTAGTIFIGR